MTAKAIPTIVQPAAQNGPLLGEIDLSEPWEELAGGLRLERFFISDQRNHGGRDPRPRSFGGRLSVTCLVLDHRRSPRMTKLFGHNYRWPLTLWRDIFEAFPQRSCRLWRPPPRTAR